MVTVQRSRIHRRRRPVRQADMDCAHHQPREDTRGREDGRGYVFQTSHPPIRHTRGATSRASPSSS